MIGTNIYISKKTQESLLKAAAFQKMSVENLATLILSETVMEKLAKFNNSEEIKTEFPVNPLNQMQPYAFLADPSEAVIPEDDWEINQDQGANNL